MNWFTSKKGLVERDGQFYREYTDEPLSKEEMGRTLSRKEQKAFREENFVWMGIQIEDAEMIVPKDQWPFHSSKNWVSKLGLIHVISKHSGFEGLYQCYWWNGQLYEKVPYINGHRHGVYKRYNKKGTLLKIGDYKDGVPYGFWVEYHNNGKTKSEGLYEGTIYNGPFRTGRWRWWSGTGRLTCDGTYKVFDGKYGLGEEKHGKWTYYKIGGEIDVRRSGFYVKGLKASAADVELAAHQHLFAEEDDEE